MGHLKKSCFSINQNLQNPRLYCMLLRAFVCRLQARPVYASITISCLKPQAAYGLAVQSRKTVKTEGAARAESNLFEPTPNREPPSLLEWPRCEGGRAKLNYAEVLQATIALKGLKRSILNSFALSGRANDRSPNIPRALPWAGCFWPFRPQK